MKKSGEELKMKLIQLMKIKSREVSCYFTLFKESKLT